MFMIVVVVLAVVMAVRNWHRATELGTSTFAKLEFDDDHPRQPSVRSELIARASYATKAHSVGLVVGAVVGVGLWATFQVMDAATPLVALSVVIGGILGKAYGLWRQSTPAEPADDLRVPPLWTGALALSGLTVIALLVLCVVTQRNLGPTLFCAGAAVLALGLMSAAHVGQWMLRRRSFVPAAGPAWNRSLRALAVSQLLVAAVLAGFGATFVGAFALPRIRGYMGSGDLVVPMVTLLAVSFLGVVLTAIFARGLRRRLAA